MQIRVNERTIKNLETLMTLLGTTGMTHTMNVAIEKLLNNELKNLEKGDCHATSTTDSTEH